MNAPHPPPNRHARTLLPPLIHERLRHLAFDLHTSLADLLVEGAVLLLRYHDRGRDLPEPTRPAQTNQQKGPFNE